VNILDKIVRHKKEEVESLKSKYKISDFADSEFYPGECINILDTIKSTNSISIISEIKKASPSKGIIKEDFNHLKIAEEYLSYGVDAISILTDKDFFQGNTSYLSDIKKISNVPLLRKDFIIDEIQIHEAKAIGADFILLICEVLDKYQIKDYSVTVNELGMRVLLELHSEKQLDQIDFDINKLVGVNNRNLENFTVDLKTTEHVSKQIPDDILVVSESGIHKQNDINYLKTLNIDAILIGEHLMKSGNINSSLQELKQWCKIES
jgi:indole-3-glycerol phosphate synthase